MSFDEIFKKSFLEGFRNSGITEISMIICFAITSILAIYIFFLYKILTRKTFYSKTFNISLVALSLITCSIILTMQSNVVISLGMVGALSIVRFRTAIKEPLDLVFLFWAISIGIICGANMPIIAFAMSLILTILIVVLNVVPIGKAPMLLVINTSNIEVENSVLEIIKKFTKHYKVKSRNITKNEADMIIELRIKEEAKLIKEISTIKEITSVSLLTHEGEATF